MVPDRGRYNFVVHCNCADASRAPGVGRSQAASVLHVRCAQRLVTSRRLSGTDWAPSLLLNSGLDFRFTAGRDSEWRATRALASIMPVVRATVPRPLRLRGSG